MEYSGLIYYTNNQSILPLRGLASEIGTYVCSWNNSRGEARRRIFTFAEETKTANITIAICTFVLFVLTLGLGISWYLDKVSQILKRFVSSVFLEIIWFKNRKIGKKN